VPERGGQSVARQTSLLASDVCELAEGVGDAMTSKLEVSCGSCRRPQSGPCPFSFGRCGIVAVLRRPVMRVTVPAAPSMVMVALSWIRAVTFGMPRTAEQVAEVDRN
jgi:hypothetical protein